MKTSFQYHISGLLRGISLTLIILLISCASNVHNGSKNDTAIVLRAYKKALEKQIAEEDEKERQQIKQDSLETYKKQLEIEILERQIEISKDAPTTSMSSQKTGITELPPPETPTNIAVVDFTGNNVSSGEVRALTDRLRVELFKTKYFKVLEREMMEEILTEQGFQQTGCATDECMVRVGKLIGVEQIVGGSISKVGRTYSVSSRIVSVETGKILKGTTYDYKGEIDELLTEGMRMVAIGLVQ